VDLSGKEGNANMSIYTDGSKQNNTLGLAWLQWKTPMKYTQKRKD
jgi:hypothetical protein